MAVPSKSELPPIDSNLFSWGDGIQKMLNSGMGSGLQFILFLWVWLFVNTCNYFRGGGLLTVYEP